MLYLEGTYYSLYFVACFSSLDWKLDIRVNLLYVSIIHTRGDLAMYELKTKETDNSLIEFITKIEHPKKSKRPIKENIRFA